MIQEVRELSEKVTAQLPQVCNELFEMALLEVFDMMAPNICTYFNLFSKTNRGSITTEGLRNIFGNFHSIVEMKEVFKHRLQQTWGILDAIRTANVETFTTSTEMI